jgi:hypothetical protein
LSLAYYSTFWQKINRKRAREKSKIRSQDFSQKLKNEAPKFEKMPQNRAIRRFLGIFARVHGLETIKYDTSPSKKGCFGISLKQI